MANPDEQPQVDLAAAIERARAHALAAGALLPVEVEAAEVHDGGVDFRIEWLSSLAMKDLAGKIPRPGDKAKAFNPFLPYERDLHVADLSDTHVAILNKFPSYPGHLVIITKAFVEQEAPLDRADILACAGPLAAIGGFVFFNSGSVSGASQRHRHLQLLPGFEPPIAALLPREGPTFAPARADRLPFEHVFSRLDPDAFDDAGRAVDRLLDLINAACDRCGLVVSDGLRTPYNLMITRDWLLLVPRREECSAGVSLSGLSYSGLIGLRSPEQLDQVRRHGPMRMLAEAAGR